MWTKGLCGTGAPQAKRRAFGGSRHAGCSRKGFAGNAGSADALGLMSTEAADARLEGRWGRDDQGSWRGVQMKGRYEPIR